MQPSLEKIHTVLQTEHYIINIFYLKSNSSLKQSYMKFKFCRLFVMFNKFMNYYKNLNFGVITRIIHLSFLPKCLVQGNKNITIQKPFILT